MNSKNDRGKDRHGRGGSSLKAGHNSKAENQGRAMDKNGKSHRNFDGESDTRFGNRTAPSTRGQFSAGSQRRGGGAVRNVWVQKKDKSKKPKEEPIEFHEIAHGMQLRVCYKIPPQDDLTAVAGFHARYTKNRDSGAHYIMFRDVESLEAAKKKLEKEENVSSVDYMGLRSSKKQVHPIFLRHY